MIVLTVVTALRPVRVGLRPPLEMRARLPNGSWRKVSLRILILLLRSGQDSGPRFSSAASRSVSKRSPIGGALIMRLGRKPNFFAVNHRH
jgi:hypothetical protein